MSKNLIIWYLVIIAILVIAWELFTNNTSRLLISCPSEMYNYFKEHYDMLINSFWVTFYESFLGLVLGTIFSFLVIILCLYVPKFMNFILPGMIISQVIPLITLAPLLIILFGVGVLGKIVMSALLSFFPIFINFAIGIKLISENLIEFMYICNNNTTQKIRHLYFPLSSPHIISGLKIASTLSVIGAIVAEFNGADIGLGKNLFLAAKRLEPELMMCSLVLSTLLGGGLYLFIHIIEKNIGKWYLK